MKIEIVGAGPGGLYLAILLKKAGAADVRVRERNAPDATFGWGVVFSEETLGALRDADPESHLEITDTFARWNRLDIRFQGRSCARRATRSRRSPAPACWRSSSGGPATSASSSSSASRSRSSPRPTSSSAPTARTRPSVGSASSGRRSSRRARSTSGSAPTSSSTPSPSSSRRPSTGSSTSTPTPTTSA